ncbi:MAG: DUF1800 domain-containing protein [Vicinamibacteraceae bacterium]
MPTAASAFRVCAAPLVAGALLLSAASTAPLARPASLDDAAIIHVLDRTGFGARVEDVARVRELGLDRYLDEQLHPEGLSDAAVRTRMADFETLALDSSTIAERYYAPLLRERRANRKDPNGAPVNDKEEPRSPSAAAGRLADMDPAERARLRELRETGRLVLDELGQQKVLRAVYSPRQLEEVLVDFWFNHFNVFAGKGPVRGYLTEYERDAIRPHVLGRFRDMLGAVAKSPAMLFYLDNWQSVDPKAAEDLTRRMDQVGNGTGMRGRVGRRRLEQRMGTAATPETVAQIKQRMPRGLNENYARELMELHTMGVAGGYTQADVVDVARAFTGWTIRGPRQGGGYAFEERRHAKGPKLVLGTTIDAGGERDGEAVLDLLASHPSTATFIATKLARRFVADEPPPALVTRAAATFTSSRGDLRAVVRTILTSPEFLGVEARRAKVKTPFEFAMSALRMTRADVTDASPIVQQLRTLGMPLYFAQPPTGYADTAVAWVNTGALVNRMNFAVDLTANRLRGVRVDLAELTGTTDADAAKAWATAHLLRGQASDATAATLARGTDLASVAALSLGSPEFQRR